MAMLVYRRVSGRPVPKIPGTIPQRVATEQWDCRFYFCKMKGVLIIGLLRGGFQGEGVP